MNLTENTEKTKSRWFFSAVIGNYGNEYSKTPHGAPGVFITIMTIMVMNVPIIIGMPYSYDNSMNTPGAPWVVHCIHCRNRLLWH